MLSLLQSLELDRTLKQSMPAQCYRWSSSSQAYNLQRVSQRTQYQFWGPKAKCTSDFGALLSGITSDLSLAGVGGSSSSLDMALSLRDCHRYRELDGMLDGSLAHVTVQRAWGPDARRHSRESRVQDLERLCYGQLLSWICSGRIYCDVGKA